MTTTSARQATILAFIRTHHATHGYSPTYREIGAEVGLGSASSVAYQLRQLALAGHLRLTPGLPRAIVLLQPEVTG